MRVQTLGLTLLLLLPGAFAIAPLQAGGNGQTDQPSEKQVTIQLNLTGTATQTNGGPNDGFTAYLNVSGTGTQSNPNGNGVQIRADNLTAAVLIVRNADNTTVENYTARVGFHAQEASGIAQGLPTGSFRFNLELKGNRAKVILGNENPDERVLAMNAHGNTTGTPDNSVFAVDASGQATMQRDGTGSGATHYNIDLSGAGSTGSIQ